MTRRGGVLVALASCLQAGCGPLSIMSREGPGASAILDLWWWLFWMTVVPTVFVLGFLGLAVWRRRRATHVDSTPEARNVALILWLGGAMPLAVILVMMVQSFRTGSRAAMPPEAPTVRIEVVGHQFWWEIRYPDLGVVTANELHMPAGQVAMLEITSADVIHSFWVPALHGKIDMLPGRTNVFWLQADRPGVYRGVCAEFCGTQHALMGMLLVAESPEDFAAWVDRQRQPAAVAAEQTEQAPAFARGEVVYEQSGCHLCHAVADRFEPPVANAGPDLTHLASRQTLGAAAMGNTEENLRDWIRNPHARKPGVRMPGVLLTDEDFDALVGYLRALR